MGDSCLEFLLGCRKQIRVVLVLVVLSSRGRPGPGLPRSLPRLINFTLVIIFFLVRAPIPGPGIVVRLGRMGIGGRVG